jgi:hypothetical protein
VTIQALFDAPPFSLAQADKEQRLTSLLGRLTDRHREGCPAYAQLLRVLHPNLAPAARLEEIPFVPVGLYKSHKLVSVPEEQVFRVLTSSGTTGQGPSRIYLDRETAGLQSAALVHTLGSVLGTARLPMLILDTESILTGSRRFSARAVGILGLMSFGRRHTYLLDDELRMVPGRLEAFLDQFGGQPFLMFGFTYLAWQALYEQLAPQAHDLSKGILIHSGGWKKLTDRELSPVEFRSRLREHCGLTAIYNFYGMVEQVGSVFLEGADDCLYASNFSDVIVRDPITWQPVPDGQTGVIQVLSALPQSYPGHSILTEDLGVIVERDRESGRRRGKAFRVLGRVPRAEVRGCSDTAVPEESQ